MITWGITNGSAGMIAQVRGVGEMLGGEFILKTCKRRMPWDILSGNWHKGALTQLTADSDSLTPPWPDVVLTSGRRSAAFGIAIKKASGGKTKAVHLTDPRISPKHFDLVVPLAHDLANGDNVMKTVFALHHITPEKLAEAHAAFAPQFETYPEPHIAVMFGGTTNRYTLNAARLAHVIAQLQTFHAAVGGSLLITASRRTGEANRQKLEHAFAAAKNTYFYRVGANPYLGLLAIADALIVTNDSVNMMSEAAYTGKPLYILPMPGHTDTHPARFAEMLVEKGIAKWLGTTLEQWSYHIPDERAAVAARILAL